ncbi:hypothetical protein MMPV_009098 [Pyropia vietnamensis]
MPGFYSEVCDFAGSCPSRLAFLISAGVISVLLAGVALIGLLQQINVLTDINVYICGFLALWWGITAGVASSPRTYGGGIINVGLLSVWLAFLGSIAAAVGAAAGAGWFMGAGGGVGGGEGRAASEHDVEEEPVLDDDKPRAGSVSTDGDAEVA